jgi:ribosomal protein L21E
MTKFKVGEKVKVEVDPDMLKMMQAGHGDIGVCEESQAVGMSEWSFNIYKN